MPLAIQELHAQGLEFPVLIGGAAINRNFGRRALYPGGHGVRRRLRARRLLLQGRLRGPGRDGPARRAASARAELVAARSAPTRDELREKGPEPEELPTDDDSVRSAARTDVPVPSRRSGACARSTVDLDEVYPPPRHARAVQAPLGRARREGRGVEKLLDEDFRPRLERMWAEQDYLHPRALLGYFPCYSEGNEIVVLDPEDRETVLERFVCPRQPKARPHLPGRLLPPEGQSGELDVVALQAVTAGDEVTELMAQLEADGEFAEQLFVHGLGVQTAEGMAEWLHAKVRDDLGIAADQGRRYSWGYPACPSSPSTRRSSGCWTPSDRPAPVRRLRARARAVDARDRRPPPAGRLLRHEVRHAAGRRAPDDVIAAPRDARRSRPTPTSREAPDAGASRIERSLGADR